MEPVERKKKKTQVYNIKSKTVLPLFLSLIVTRLFRIGAHESIK